MNIAVDANQVTRFGVSGSISGYINNASTEQISKSLMVFFGSYIVENLFLSNKNI